MFNQIYEVGWLTRLQSTGCKRITNESIRAAAQWVVADHTALSLISTYTNAWVNTLPVNACTTQRTVRVDGTFRLASKVWVSKVARKARTHCPVFHNLTFGVWSTWSRDAWIRWSTDYWERKRMHEERLLRAGPNYSPFSHLLDVINKHIFYTYISTASSFMKFQITHLVHSERRDRLSCCEGRSTRDCGWPPHRWHQCHRYLDKDQHTAGCCKLSTVDTGSWWHTQGDIVHTGYQSSLQCRYRCHEFPAHGSWHSDHKFPHGMDQDVP